MKTLTLILSTLLASAAAQADGFVCQSYTGDLNVRVYNNTKGATRSAAVMVLSNPTVSYGRKTIATFRDTSANLVNQGAMYFAAVDANLEETSRGGELIAGTKLGYVESVALYLQFNYNQPLQEGEELPGSLILTKTNGQRVDVALACARYLKGE